VEYGRSNANQRSGKQNHHEISGNREQPNPQEGDPHPSGQQKWFRVFIRVKPDPGLK
jgi:hypothetical protein